MTRTSILIPSYNQARFLEESVGSAINQSGAEEILISDDKSTDSSALVLRELMVKDRRVSVAFHDQNQGIPGNIDRGLRATRGDFVLRLDADDRLLPDACLSLAAALDQNPRAGAAHGQVWEINESGARVRQRLLARTPGYQEARVALAESAKGYRVTANIVMFRRAALVSVNYLADRPSFAEDYHLYAALAAQGWGNVYVGADVGEYRNYTNPSRSARKAQELRGLNAVFNDVLKPAFEAAGLPQALLEAGSRSLSISQARHLLEVADLPAHQSAELLQLLDSLHPTPWPRLFLTARRCGLAPAILGAQHFQASTKRMAKKAWIGTRNAIALARQ